MRPELQIATLANPELWDAIHAISGIPSHSRTYAEALTHSGITTQLALVHTAEGGMVLPFFERYWQGKSDVCTWLSVSGARLWGDPVPALAVWHAEAQARGWVAGYIQVEPESMLPNIESAAEGNTVFLLDLDHPDPLSQASQIIRRKLRQGVAAGAALVEDRSLIANALVELYPLAMGKLRAKAIYSLPDLSLRGFCEAPDALVLGAALHDDRIECAMIFPTQGNRAEFFLSASTQEGRPLTAWLIAQAIGRLRTMGVRQLNLGGGVRPNDGLFDFKARFGGSARRLGIMRQIYDPEAYRALCATVDTKPQTSWFPAYRSI